MPEWSFRGRLITSVLIITLLAILTAIASLVTVRVMIANMTRSTGDADHIVAEARALEALGVENVAQARACLLPGGAGSAPAVFARSAAMREMAAQLAAQITDPTVRARLDAVVAAEREYQAAFALALGGPDERRGPAAPVSGQTVAAGGDRLERALAELTSHAESIRVGRVSISRTEIARVEQFLVAVTLGTILVLSVMSVLLITGLNSSYGRQSAARSQAEYGQTAARASLTEVEAASRLKDEFLATVSHELRNPLAPILTWTQLLRSGSLDAEKSRRALEVIERNVISQSQLIDDLVDVSRVVSGKFRLDVRPIDLMPVIRAAAESQAPASDAKQIRMQLVLDERAGLISGDWERLQQVMWNLISNAIKFTPKGGRVQVLLQRSESHVEIVISDSGVGIPQEFLPHVFEPFRQAVGGSMRRHAGLGLGLSIVRHIVELHGGEISAQSEGSGRGSTFRVKFPLLATAAEGSPPQRHPIAGDQITHTNLGRLDGVGVLIVEDEPSASEALVVLFEACGAEARSAGSAAEAIALLDVWRPSVIVSDIAMPGEDGYSFMRRVRQRSSEQGGAIPAVALTAYAKIEDRVTILAAGFQMYLSKPADPNELIAVVGSLARRRGV